MADHSRTEIDHLVIAAEDLPSGVAWLERRLGVTLEAGGCHPSMGTHNALLRLNGSCYLEVIAIDPEAAAIDRMRWFELDDAKMRAKLRERPRLIHWVARTARIELLAGRCSEPLGKVTRMSRGRYQWLITIPEDGKLPCGGLVPSLIKWGEGGHPVLNLPDRGCRLRNFRACHPDRERVERALIALESYGDLTLEFGSESRLSAEIETPHGMVVLDS